MRFLKGKFTAGLLIEWLFAGLFLAGGGALAWGIRSGVLFRSGPELANEPERIRVEQAGGRVLISVDPELISLSGITTQPVRLQPVARTASAPARLRFPPGGSVWLAAPLAGRVEAVSCAVGVEVPQGAPLLELAADAVARAKGELRAAVIEREAAARTYDRLLSLSKSQLVREQDLIDAHRALQEAEAAIQRGRAILAVWGVGEEEMRAVMGGEDSSGVVRVRSPMRAIVLELKVTRGEAVQEGAALVHLVSPWRLWAEIMVEEETAAEVRPGQPVTVRVEGVGDRAGGKVLFVSHQVDASNRKVRVFAELPNPDGRLRAEMFGTARIELEPARERRLVPVEAVQSVSGRSFVLVQTGEDSFELRPVIVGEEFGSDVEVLAGLKEGEAIAVKGAFLLFAEVARRGLLPGGSAKRGGGVGLRLSRSGGVALE